VIKVCSREVIDRNKKRANGEVGERESEGDEDEEGNISVFVPHHT
jgi:hypothetical protein